MACHSRQERQLGIMKGRNGSRSSLRSQRRKASKHVDVYLAHSLGLLLHLAGDGMRRAGLADRGRVDTDGFMSSGISVRIVATGHRARELGSLGFLGVDRIQST